MILALSLSFFSKSNKKCIFKLHVKPYSSDNQ